MQDKEYLEALQELEALSPDGITDGKQASSVREVHLSKFLKQMKAEECILHNKSEVRKERALKAIRVIHCLK